MSSVNRSFGNALRRMNALRSFCSQGKRMRILFVCVMCGSACGSYLDDKRDDCRQACRRLFDSYSRAQHSPMKSGKKLRAKPDGRASASCSRADVSAERRRFMATHRRSGVSQRKESLYLRICNRRDSLSCPRVDRLLSWPWAECQTLS